MAIAAAEVEQGGAVGGFGEAFDAANENGMVAGQVGGFVRHFEASAGTGQQRCAAQAGLPGQAGEAVGRPGGEAVGKFLLVGGEDGDGVVAGAAEGFEIVRVVIQAPEHERRRQRNSRERIDGQADGVPIGINGGDDGNAGRETSQCVAQGSAVVRILAHWFVAVQSKAAIIRAPAPPVEAELSPTPAFSERLIAWQKSAGRHDLPWQNTRDAYRVWLSEIMLQQTQVTTVIPYYQRFLARFPDVAALAAAPLDEVIAHWAGLGYYARARNLHRCAQQVVAEHGGRFPAQAEALAELPGIGRSTAAAIAAFAYGQRSAILDGNVKRVLCRCYGIEGFPGTASIERELWALAESLLPETGIEAYTQGLMDLGATCCTRSRPRCDACPMAAICIARRDGRQAELPTARPKAAIPDRSADFVVFCDPAGRVLLQRRPPAGIWGGLLVVPEGSPATLAANLGLTISAQQALPAFRHVFTHFRLTLRPHLCLVKASQQINEAGQCWLSLNEALTAGTPTPIQKLLGDVAALWAEMKNAGAQGVAG